MDSVLTNIEEFYNQYEEKGDLTLEQVKLICSTPFKFVRKTFSEGTLKDIRLQYFGVFEVSPSRVKYSKKTLEDNYNNNLISKQRFTDRMKVLDGYESKD